jgi:hypothetical protein
MFEPCDVVIEIVIGPIPPPHLASFPFPESKEQNGTKMFQMYIVLHLASFL